MEVLDKKTVESFLEKTGKRVLFCYNNELPSLDKKVEDILLKLESSPKKVPATKYGKISLVDNPDFGDNIGLYLSPAILFFNHKSLIKWMGGAYEEETILSFLTKQLG